MPTLSRNRANWTPGLLALSLLLNVYFIVTGLRGPSPSPEAPVASAASRSEMEPPPSAPEQSKVPPQATNTGQGQRPRSFSGPLRGSIAATLAARLDAAEADLLAAHLARSLGWQIDLRSDPRPDDRFTVIYEFGADVERDRDLGPGDPIEILAYEYRSQRHASTYRGFRFKPTGSRWPVIWNDDGSEVSRRLESSPIDDYEAITARLNDGRQHDGIDFKVPVGTPVRAPQRAKVLRKNWNVRANGYCVDLLYEASGLHGIFLHLSEIHDDVVVLGRRIEPGTVFALSGNTGRTTNPHLHYALRKGKTNYLDPFHRMATLRRRIESQDRSEFEAQRDALAELLVERSAG